MFAIIHRDCDLESLTDTKFDNVVNSIAEWLSDSELQPYLEWYTDAISEWHVYGEPNGVGVAVFESFTNTYTKPQCLSQSISHCYADSVHLAIGIAIRDSIVDCFIISSCFE